MPNGNGSSISDRARGHRSAVDPQDGLFDQDINDDALERLLDEREDRKGKRLEANRKFKEKDDLVKARLEEFSLGEGEVARVGKYRIEKRTSRGGHREFDVAPGARLNITLFDA